MGDEHAEDRLRTTALTLFAGVALSLATLGVYGTLSYVVSLRRREVGFARRTRCAAAPDRRRIYREKRLSNPAPTAIARLPSEQLPLNR